MVQERQHLLEDRSRKPHRTRSTMFDISLVGRIRKIRREDPSWSAGKVRMLLLREKGPGEVPSRATVGRIIRRYSMFYRADIMAHRRQAVRRMRQEKKRQRLPYGMRAVAPGKVIEFDMKHISLPGTRLSAMCGIDQYTRQAFVHVSSRCASNATKKALMKITGRFGGGITIVNDNGSENKAKAKDWLEAEGIKQMWARPYRSKDKPFIERFIGTLQRECLDYHYEPMSVTEMQKIIDTWIVNYETIRPHEALDFLISEQFAVNYYLTKHSPVS